MSGNIKTSSSVKKVWPKSLCRPYHLRSNVNLNQASLAVLKNVRETSVKYWQVVQTKVCELSKVVLACDNKHAFYFS